MDVDGPQPEKRASLPWRTLLVAGALAMVVAIVALELVIIRELVPPLVIIAALLLVGIFLLRRGGRGGAVLIGVVSLVFTAFMIPFAPATFAFPASTSDFVINLVSLGGALLAVVAAVAVFRARDLDARSPAAKTLATVVTAIVVLGTVGSIAARLMREDPLGQPQDLTVTAKDTEFTPEELAAPTDVSIFIENKDLTAHTFTVDELGIDEAIPGGGSARAEVEEAEPGSYEFTCEVPGHEQMKGTLTVGGPGT